MKLEDVDEARASWMKLDMVCIQLCQGAVSAWCTDKPCIVDSVPDHMVVVAFQKLAAFISVVVQEPHSSIDRFRTTRESTSFPSSPCSSTRTIAVEKPGDGRTLHLTWVANLAWIAIPWSLTGYL